MRLLWTLLFLWCPLSTSHAALGKGDGGPPDSGGVLSTGLLSTRNLKTVASSGASSSGGSTHFHEQGPPEDNQEYIYLSDSDIGETTDDGAQLTKLSSLPTLLAIPPVRTAALALSPYVRDLVTNQDDAVGKPDQGDLSAQGSPKESDVVGEGPFNLKEVTAPGLSVPKAPQGEGINKEAATLPNQQLSTAALEDPLAQEGLLGTVVPNSWSLVREKERLLSSLLGSEATEHPDSLLEATGLPALEALLCRGSLGGLCGHGSLAGINDVLKNTHLGNANSRLNITRFDLVQVTWKAQPLSSLQLDFQTKLTINFPGLLRLLSGSLVDVNITAPFTLLQAKPGHFAFVLQNCQPVVIGIRVQAGLLSSVIESTLKWSLKTSLPKMLCPVVRFWFYIINQQLTFLKNVYSLPLLRNLHPPLLQKLLPSEQCYRLDFKDKRFPASFIKWLIETAETWQPPCV